MRKNRKLKKRCWWCGDDPTYIAYHDKEWGRPIREDSRLFEMLILEGFQAGLSWITVLKKRPNFRKAFLKFNPNKISKFKAADISRLMKDPGIIRNRLKIKAAITNARAYLEVKKEFGSFAKYIWQFTNYRTIRAQKITRDNIPTRTAESDAMSKDLQKRGFKFVGTTICYAFMQAVGMVDDHSEDCFLYKHRRT
jgi:DNA-3-methyladenine glycosylase I